MSATESSSLPPLELLNEERLRRLIHVSHEVNSTLDLDVLLPRLIEVVMDTVGSEASSLWLLDGEVLRCEIARGPVASAVEGLELPLGVGLVGAALQDGRSSLVQNAYDADSFLSQVDEATGFQTRSVITVPLIARGERLGVMQVINRLEGDGLLREDDLHFLEALEDDLAAAVRNAKLLDAERRAKDLHALLEVSHEITSTLDLDRVLVTLVNMAGRAIPFERCVLAIQEHESLQVRAISGEAQVDRRSAAIREIERFLLWAAERRETLYVPDLNATDGPAVALRERFERYLSESGAGSILVVPVRDGEGELGVMLFEFREPDTLTEWGREAAALLANEGALAIRNAQLYADVPLIGFLDPLAKKRRELAALPGSTWLKYGAIVAVAVLALTLIRLPLRITAESANVRAAVQTPARPGVGGIVEAVWVREGERVAAGARLARIRNEDLLRRIRETEAGLEQAERQALAADARGDAMNATLARVRLAELEDGLGILRQWLDAAWVVAPTDGIVLTSRLDESVGAYLEAGEPLTWIGDPDWIELELRVRQADIGEVEPGRTVRARVGAHPGRTFRGEVIGVAPLAELDGETPVYTVRALLDNRAGLLRPGMSARARVIARSVSVGELIVRRPWRWLRMRIWW